VCVGGKYSGRIDPAGGSETWPTTHPPTPFRDEKSTHLENCPNFGFVKRQNDIAIFTENCTSARIRTKISTHQSSPSVVEADRTVGKETRYPGRLQRGRQLGRRWSEAPWSSHALRCCSWPVRCSQNPHVTAPLNRRAAFCSHSSVYEAVRVYVRACVAWSDGRHGTQLLFAATPCLCSQHHRHKNALPQTFASIEASSDCFFSLDAGSSRAAKCDGLASVAVVV
jgi:hypothetical protein